MDSHHFRITWHWQPTSIGWRFVPGGRVACLLVGIGVALTGPLVGGGSTSGQVVIQPREGGNQDDGPVIAGNQFTHDSNSILMSPPRDVVRPLIQAQRMIDEDRQVEAAELIGSFLGNAGAEDYLVPSLSFPGQSISLRQRAETMLSGLNADALAAYELRFGVQADQRLKRAVAIRDFNAIADIMHRYSFTAAGAEAAVLLGHHELDVGHPVSAAACFQRVLALPAARRRFDPQLSVLAATCWMLAGNPEKSAAILEDLKGKTPAGWIQFQGNRVPLMAADQSPQDWLAALVGGTPLGSHRMVHQWLLAGGDAQHNARSEGGFPTARPKWKLPLSPDPGISSSVRNEMDQRVEEGTEWVVPSVSPLVVGTTIVMKNEQSMFGVAVETGKRIWSYPVETDLMDAGQPQSVSGPTPAEANEINRRLWNDTLSGQFSSNGELVFSIPAADALGGEGRMTRTVMSTTNRLTAVQLSTQGQLRWEVGGESGADEPALADVYFLGPPLPLGEELFAICRIQQEIRLVVLGQADGQLRWSQQLAIAGTANQRAMSIRQRSDGITPAYSDGILVCPTGNGAVVALDATARLFLWGIEFETPNRLRRPTGSDWVDARLIVSGDKVVMAAMENGKLMVFDLETGQAVTSFGRSGLKPSESAMLACVEGGAAILVGRETIQSISLNDRSVKWQQSLVRYGAPSGRGFASEGSYFFPTVDRFVVQVNLASGAIENVVLSDQVLGNLISLQGLVISQATEWLTCYESDRRVREKLQRAKADLRTLADLSPELLMLESQLQARDRDWVAALRAIELAESQSGDRKYSEDLLEMVIQAIQHDVDSVPGIVEKYQATFDPAGELRLQCHYVDYLIRHQRRQAALNVLQTAVIPSVLASGNKLGPREVKRALVAFDQPSKLVDLDLAEDPRAIIEMPIMQWIGSQLSEIQRSGSEAERAAVDLQMTGIANHRPGEPSLDRFFQLAPYGWQLLPSDFRIGLAAELLANKQWLPAEQVIESLLSDELQILLASRREPSSGSPIAVDDQALGLWIELQQSTSNEDALNRVLQRIREDRVQPSGPISLQRLENWKAAAAHPDTPLDRGRFSADDHEVLVDVENTPRNFQSNQPIDVLVESPWNRQHLRERWVFWQQTRELEVFDVFGNSRSRFSIRRFPVAVTNDVGQRSRGRLRIRGNLAIFDQGSDLVAIDLTRLDSGDAVIWNRSFESLPVTTFRNEGSVLAHEVEILPMRISGARILEVGDPSLQGLCVLDGTELHYLDILSGEARWTRRVGGGGRKLLSDDQQVVVLDLQQRTSDVIDLATGRRIAFHALPPAIGTVWEPIGTSALTMVKLGADGNPVSIPADPQRQLAIEEDEPEEQSERPDGSDAKPEPGDACLMGMYDGAAGTFRWQRRLAKEDRVARISDGRLALLLPDGRVQLIGNADGQVLAEFESGLTEKELSRVTDLGTVDQQGYNILVFNQIGATVSSVNLGPVAAQKLRQTDVILSGLFVALDEVTGQPVWPRPVRLEGFSFFPNVADSAPVLMLHRRARLSREELRSGGSQLHHVIGIDLASGRLQFNHTMPGFSIQFLEPVRWKPDSGELSVALSQYQIRYRFASTDDRPPSPVVYITEDNPLPRERTVAGAKRFDPASLLPSNANLLERARQFEQALPDHQRREQEQMKREFEGAGQ